MNSISREITRNNTLSNAKPGLQGESTDQPVARRNLLQTPISHSSRIGWPTKKCCNIFSSKDVYQLPHRKNVYSACRFNYVVARKRKKREKKKERNIQTKHYMITRKKRKKRNIQDAKVVCMRVYEVIPSENIIEWNVFFSSKFIKHISEFK